MKLFEFEAKKVFHEYGIPVPEGYTVFSVNEISEETINKIGYPVIIKSQVLVSGRGRAGGICKARNFFETVECVKKVFLTSIKGLRPSFVLIEEFFEILRELYIAFIVDRSVRKPVLLSSSIGGMEIEEIISKKPELLYKIPIDPYIGLKEYEVRNLAYKLNIPKEYVKQFISIIKSMYEIFNTLDAELVESNPLALTSKGIYALDARIIIDDNSLFRQKHMLEKYLVKDVLRDKNINEILAERLGFSYVELQGDIGVIGNGAGLTMATMDLVEYYGGKPACFLDIGGGARRNRVKEAVKLLFKNNKVKAILINVFGGITRCDEVAYGIIEALKEYGKTKSLVIRIVGTAEKEAHEILRAEGLKTYTNIVEAVKEIIKLTRR